MQTNRLYFIDAVRAFAILMMLQGHFIDTLLANSYRDLNDPTFRLWSYFRGITAPTFFTISGLIFTYLLLNSKEKGLEKLKPPDLRSRGQLLINQSHKEKKKTMCPPLNGLLKDEIQIRGSRG